MSDSNTIEVFADDRVRPSIDKVIIIGHSSLNILNDDIFNLVGKYGNNQFQCKETISNAQTGYKKLYEIKYRQFYEHGKYEVYNLTLLVGYMVGGFISSKNSRKFKIEYNPNKFKVPNWLADYFLRRQYYAEEVKNIDLCFDFIGFRKHSFRYILNNANTGIMAVGTQNNLTDVIGYADKSANRIKIYDKKKERKPFYELQEETTRVEITLDWKYFGSRFNTTGGDIFILQKSSKALEQVFIKDTSTTDPYLYALTCLNEDELQNALSLMSFKTRQKYKQLLKENSEYKLYFNTLSMLDFLRRQICDILWCCGVYFKKR